MVSTHNTNMSSSQFKPNNINNNIPKGRHPNALARKYGHDLPGSKVLRNKQAERESGITTSKAVIKKQIRDLKRLLAKAKNNQNSNENNNNVNQENNLPFNFGDEATLDVGLNNNLDSNNSENVAYKKSIPATKILELERKLEFLTSQLNSKDSDIIEKKMWEKYKYVRFVEQKKIRRKIDQTERRIDQIVQELMEIEQDIDLYTNDLKNQNNTKNHKNDDDDDNQNEANEGSDNESEDGGNVMMDAIEEEEVHSEEGTDEESGSDEDDDEESDEEDDDQDTKRLNKINEISHKRLIIKALENVLKGLKIKLAYTKHYPRDIKYMSLFPKSGIINNDAGNTEDKLLSDTVSSVDSEIITSISKELNLKQMINRGLSNEDKKLQLKIFERLAIAVENKEVERPAFILRQKDISM